MNLEESTPASDYKESASDDFRQNLAKLLQRDRDLAEVVEIYGYPAQWQREPGFATLIRIILEQQVSYASAKAAF